MKQDDEEIDDEEKIEDDEPELVKLLLESNQIKFHNVIKGLESEARRPLDNMEVASLERDYVKITLKMWLEESIENVLKYLENIGNISIDMPTLLGELHSLQSMKDIPKLAPGSKLLEWCGGPRFRLILDQKDPFETTLHSVNLVLHYFKQFKGSCFEVLSHCPDIRDNVEKHQNFIIALKDFLSFLNDGDYKRPNTLSEIFLNKLNEKTGQELANNLVEMFALPEPVERFKTLTASLAADEWTLKLESLIKEACKKYLLPRTTVESQTEGGRRIVLVRGNVIYVNQIKKKMLELKRETIAQEIQIVGLVSVHIDCDLEHEIWHGINVVVITDKLFVDVENVCWDVSGQNAANFELETAPSGQHPGNDGMAGKLKYHNFVTSIMNSTLENNIGDHGMPGESGGNVYIICTDLSNAERWTILSEGGHGSDGQNGGDGQSGKNGKDAPKKWNKEYFDCIFPSMAKNDAEQCAVATRRVLGTLEAIMPKENWTYGKHAFEGWFSTDNNFFIEGATREGFKVTVSKYSDNLVGRAHALIFCKGKLFFILQLNTDLIFNDK